MLCLGLPLFLDRNHSFSIRVPDTSIFCLALHPSYHCNLFPSQASMSSILFCLVLKDLLSIVAAASIRISYFLDVSKFLIISSWIKRVGTFFEHLFILFFLYRRSALPGGKCQNVSSYWFFVFVYVYSYAWFEALHWYCLPVALQRVVLFSKPTS